LMMKSDMYSHTLSLSCSYLNRKFIAQIWGLYFFTQNTRLVLMQHLCTKHVLRKEKIGFQRRKFKLRKLI